MDNNEIKKYIVKITYKNYGGSGVIIPLLGTQEYFYIFTAKHTFFDKDVKIEDRDILNIENLISIENPDIGKINVTKEDIQSDIDKKYDLLIFRIPVNLNPKIKDLKPLSIFSDDFRDCTVMGYPKARMNKDTKYDAFVCSYKQQNEKPYIFEMDSNKLLTTHRDKELNPKDTISGISGSGVFVKGNTEKLYLVAIQIQSATHNALIAIDLREIFDELNEKLNNTLTLGGYRFFEEIGLDIDKLEFIDLFEKLDNNKIQEIKNNDDAFLEDSNYIRKTTKAYTDLQEKMKELSDTYLYQGIIFHKNGKNQKATNRFKKAITLYPEYKHYFAKAKYEREHITKEQKDAKEKIDKESSFSSDISIAIDALKSDIESYKRDEKYKKLEESYQQIISLLSIEFDKNENEIKDLSKEFSKVLIFNDKFIEAENILLKIEDDAVAFDLYKIYTSDEFSKNSCLNKKQFSNKLIDLLGRLNRESSEYEDIKNKLEELNIFDNQMIEFHEKFVSLENKYENTVEKLTQDIQLLSTHVSDKTLLNKINFQVYKSDKKMDKLSIGLSEKIDIRADKIDVKLDLITEVFKKTNNKKLDSFLENTHKSNRALVSKVQTMYYQNDRVNRLAKESLEKSIKSIIENLNKTTYPITESVKDESKYIDEVKNIIEKSNGHFYKGIQGLLEKETDSYNKKLLEMSIAFTKKENELHIENLEEKVDNRDSKISLYQDEIKKLETDIDSLALDYQKSETQSLKEGVKFQELNKKYTKFRESINTTQTKNLTETERLIYEDKIEDFQILIEQLKGKNEQIDDLKESIVLSSKTADKLVSLEEGNKDKLENYIQKIEEKYEELADEKKNLLEESFSEILKDINSSIDTFFPASLDKEDFEKVYLQLEKLDSKLDDMEENYELKIDSLTERFNKLISNPKNKKRLQRISRQIKGTEQKFEELKKGQNPKITLRLLSSDLENIELIMRDYKWKSIYKVYAGTRQVTIGVILMMSIIALFINEPYSSLIEKVSMEKIINLFK